MIYLDNAATSGIKPSGVVNAVTAAMKKYSANPGRSGHTASINTADMVYKTREKAADFFGSSAAENVAFTLNCTHALNCVIKGVLKRGDHVVVSDMEHNAVMRPLEKLKKDGIITWDTAETSADDNVTAHNFEQLIKDNTRLLICTNASNVFGFVLPIAKIGELCRKKGILFCVDSAQSAGVLPIDMQKQNIDFLCVAPHKGLYAPMGTGILIAEKPLDNTLLEGGTGSESFNLSQPDTMPERLESGTVNVVGIAGISAGIDFVNSRGIKNIYNHEFCLARQLFEGLKKLPKAVLYNDEIRYMKNAPVISFNISGYGSDNVADILNKRGIAVRPGFHCAPSAHTKMGSADTGTVRVSPGLFNNDRQIAFLLNILKKL